MSRLAISSMRIRLVGSDGEISGEVSVPVNRSKRGRNLDHKTWDRAKALSRFKWYLGREDHVGVDAAYEALVRHGCLREAIVACSTGRAPCESKARALLTLWNSRGLWSLPRSMAQHLPEFAEALKRFAPRHEGPALTLYRGQSLARYQAGVVGIGWTASFDVAKVFAGNRSTRGAVLELHAQPEHIAARVGAFITTPKTDPKGGIEFEDEYVLDPRPLLSAIRLHSTVNDTLPILAPTNEKLR